MTTTAKVFVVVNLVLAVLTFGAAGALLGAQNDYKEELKHERGDWQNKAENYDKTIKKQQDDLLAKQQSVTRASADKSAAEERATAYQTQLAEAKTANDKLTATNETLAKNVSALEQINEKDRDLVKKMRDNEEEAVKNALDYHNKLEQETAMRADLQAQMGQLNDQMKGLTAQLSEAQAKLRDADFWLSKAKEQGFRIGASSQGSSGRVIAVDGNLVSISVGTEDGVKLGDNYNLYRGSSYVGQIKVIKVMKSMAVGEFDTKYPGSGAPPQVDDTANPGSNQ